MSALGGGLNLLSFAFTIDMKRMAVSPFRLVSVYVVPGRTFTRRVRLSRLRELFSQRAVMLDCLTGTEVLQLEDLPDFDLARLVMRIGTTLNPFDRLGLRLHLDNPVAGHELLRFSEKGRRSRCAVRWFAPLCLRGT